MTLQAVRVQVEAQRQESADLSSEAKAYARSISKQSAENAQVPIVSNTQPVQCRWYVPPRKCRLPMHHSTCARVLPAAACCRRTISFQCQIFFPQATALVDRLGKVSRGLERRNIVAAEGQASMDVRANPRIPLLVALPF